MSFVEQVGCVTLYCGDNLKVLPTLSRVTAVVTDPPYGLSFMGKRWDYDVPGIELWQACSDAMSPGGYVLSFAAPRTQHRIAVNIEDAGFDIRDIIAWVFGSGMPKGLDVGKTIDKELGAERQVVGYHERTNLEKNKAGFRNLPDKENADRGLIELTAPATPEARCWDGYNVSLKPAYEPIIVARKPLDGTVAKNCLEHGCGALNIGECRVPCDSKTKFPVGAMSKDGAIKFTSLHDNPRPDDANPTSRYPANFIHDGSDEVVALFPETGSPRPARTSKRGGKGFGMFDDEKSSNHTGTWPADTGGSAARFFYTAKVSPSERTCNGQVPNGHPTIKPKSLMSYLLTLVKQPERNLILDPFAGSGSTGLAALELGLPCVLIEREREYFDIALARLQAHHKALQAT